MANNLFSEFAPATQADWITAVRTSLRGAAIDSLRSNSYEDLAIDPLTSDADLAGVSHLGSLPGQFPFVRGATAAGYRAQPWLIAQAIDLPEPREFNAALKDALANGQSAIVLTDTLDLSDGADLGTALAEIDLRRFPIFLRSRRAPAIYALMLAALDSEAVDGLHGCIGADPLGELALTGSMPAAAFDHLAAHLQTVHANSPLLGSIAISTAIYHEAGANAVQELALALATAVTYLRALSERELDLNLVAGKLQLFLGIGENVFIEVAKFRAIKILWAQMTRAFGIGSPGQKVTLHAHSGGRNKSRRDPHVNLLRASTEALSAAIGGVDSLTIAPFDQALGPANAFSRRLARNLQLILQAELELTQLIDPAGGAWHVERLTDQIARAAWAQFQAIEARGGLLASLQSNVVQAEIEALAIRRQRDLTTRDAILVGSNVYADPDEAPAPFQAQPQSRAAVSPPGDTITAQPLTPLRLAEPYETQSRGAGVEA